MGEIMGLLPNRELYTVSVSTTVKDAALNMAEKDVGLMPVMDAGKPVGFFQNGIWLKE